MLLRNRKCPVPGGMRVRGGTQALLVMVLGLKWDTLEMLKQGRNGIRLGLKSTTLATVSQSGLQRARVEASPHDYVRMIPGMWTPRVRKEYRAALAQRCGNSWGGGVGAVTSLGNTGPHPHLHTAITWRHR